MKKLVLTIVTAGLMSGVSFAQDKPGRIGQREENQQDRIAQGVANGTLSPRETANLENKEANLNNEVRQDRKANGGNLTNKEKRQVNRQQNRLSKQIYNAKHDGAH